MATGRVPTTANSPLTAKGDLFTYDTSQARLAVGNNGETLVADSSASTGLRWQGNFAAGKNKIINGDCFINQRNFTSTTSTGYIFDRFSATVLGDGTATFSAQTFTPGSAPVAGYEAANYLRIVTTGQTAAGTFTDVRQAIEDVRNFAGQTATFSFWAKANSGTPKIALELTQNFGSGGSPSSSVNTYGGQVTLSTSWARYSLTVSVPSISGKTIGTTANTSYLHCKFIVSAGTDFNARTGSLGIQTNTFEIWGFQAEAGNVATAFQTATGTLAGELAACQRYYQKSYSTETAPATNTSLPGVVFSASGNVVNLGGIGQATFKVEMRVAPTITVYSYTSSQTGRVSDNGGTDLGASSGVANYIGTRSFEVQNGTGGTLTAAYNGFIFHYVANAEL